MPRILIVDDEPDIHELIRRFAERDGYRFNPLAWRTDIAESTAPNTPSVLRPP